MILEILVGCVLLIFAIIDIKYKAIPSVLTTAVILGLILINHNNMVWGIAGAIFGLLLYEFNFSNERYFGGIADIKILAIIGLMINNIFEFSQMMLILMGFGVLISIIRFYYYKDKKRPKEFAYVPILFLTYIILEVLT